MYSKLINRVHICKVIHVYISQINDNGVISFKSLFRDDTSRPLPLTGSDQIIAPYWADVDTRGIGQIFYRQSTDPNLLVRASREIQSALSLTHNVELKSLLIATWDIVGYYSGNTDKVHTCILVIKYVHHAMV